MRKLFLLALFFTIGIGGAEHCSAQIVKKLGKKTQKKTITRLVEKTKNESVTTEDKSNSSGNSKTKKTTADNTTGLDDDRPSNEVEDCSKSTVYVRSIEKNLDKVKIGLSNGSYSVGTMEDYISGRTGAEYFLESMRVQAPECAQHYQNIIEEVKNSLMEYSERQRAKEFAQLESLAPVKKGVYNTSSVVHPTLSVDFSENMMEITMQSDDISKNKTIEVPIRQTDVKKEKYKGAIPFNSELKFVVYQQEDHGIIEILKNGDFGAVILFGTQEIDYLRQQVANFNLPDSKSDGVYTAMGNSQIENAGVIVGSKTDNLTHNNHGPFELKEFELGSSAYIRIFYKTIEPPIATLQRAGIHTTIDGYGIRILTEYFIENKKVATFEEGPLYDDAKKIGDTWTSYRFPVWQNKKNGHGQALLENHILKENLEIGKYQFRIKHYVYNVNDNQNEYKLLLGEGDFVLNITEEGYKGLCNTEYGPSKLPVNTSQKALMLLNTLRKHSKNQGWRESFGNDVRGVTEWTKVYNVFNKYLYSKCSATFRTIYPTSNGNQSFGEIKAMFYKYPNGSIEVFGMSDQKYIPRNCN